MKYINKQTKAEMTPKIIEAIKIVIDRHGESVLHGYNNEFERTVYYQLGGKKAFGGEYPSNLYQIIREISYYDECVKARDKALKKIAIEKGKRRKDELQHQLEIISDEKYPIMMTIFTTAGSTINITLKSADIAQKFVENAQILWLKDYSYCMTFKSEYGIIDICNVCKIGISE